MSKQSVLSLASLQIKYISNSVFVRKRGREKGNRRKPVVGCSVRYHKIVHFQRAGLSLFSLVSPEFLAKAR